MLELGDTVQQPPTPSSSGSTASSARPSRSPARSTRPPGSPTWPSPTRSSRAWPWRRAPGGPPAPLRRDPGAVAVFRRLFWLCVGIGVGFGALVLGAARVVQGDGRPLRPRARVGRPHRRRQGLRHATSGWPSPTGARRCASARPSCAPTSSAPAPEPRNRGQPGEDPPVGSARHGRGHASAHLERVLRRARRTRSCRRRA